MSRRLRLLAWIEGFSPGRDTRLRFRKLDLARRRTIAAPRIRLRFFALRAAAISFPGRHWVVAFAIGHQRFEEVDV